MMEKRLTVQSPACDREALWIVDECYYGRTALMALLHATGLPVTATPTLRFDEAPGDPTFRCCLVLRLPPDPVKALLLILQLPDVPWHWSGCRTLIVLSPFRPGYLLRVIACLRLPYAVQLLDARIPANTLCDAVMVRRKYAGIGVGLRTIVLPVLSAYERRTLYESCLAMTAYTQAKKRAVSVKTVYAHRARALEKLGVRSLSGLIGRFGGKNKTCIRIIGQRYKPVGKGA
ncbi:hypothetical protein ACNHUP_004472 [Serratia marcescens]